MGAASDARGATPPRSQRQRIERTVVDGALDRDEREPFTCPCECPQVQAMCEQTCAHGVGAFACNPMDLNGCAAACTCK